MKFTFKSETAGFGSPSTTLEVEVDQLEDVLHYFADFLRGSGYHFDGHIDIVDYNETEYQSETTGGGDWPFADNSKEEALPFANYGGEKCAVCGLTRQQMGQEPCFDVRCGLGLNRV